VHGPYLVGWRRRESWAVNEIVEGFAWYIGRIRDDR
jgi:hypothetical protein